MTRKERVEETVARVIGILFFLLLEVLFAGLLITSVKGYREEAVTYRQLKYEELTFESFAGGRRYGFLIHFEEYEEPFRIDPVSADEVNRAALNRLVTAENKVVRVYFHPGHPSNKNYENDICEMVSSSHMILSLSEYNEAQRDNHRLGIILCSVFCVLILAVAWFLLFPLKVRKRLGPMHLNYTADGNEIEVYGSRLLCTLKINDDIADQRLDSFRGNFVLTGEAEKDGRAVPVEARFGRANILLYYDGRLSARKLLR